MLIKKLNVCFSCSEQSDPRACIERAFSSPGAGLVSHLGFWERECPCNGCITGQVEMGNGSPGTPQAQMVLAAGPQVGPSWPTLNIGGQGPAGGRGRRAGLRTSCGEHLKWFPFPCRACSGSSGNIRGLQPIQLMWGLDPHRALLLSWEGNSRSL